MPWEWEFNIPNIKRVVIFGVPENMESYLQAVGRGGRDDSDVLSIMFYHAYHLCHCDPTMRAFVKNKVNCRCGEILQFFNEKIEKPPILHKCCDVCSISSVIVELAQKKCLRFLLNLTIVHVL